MISIRRRSSELLQIKKTGDDLQIFFKVKRDLLIRIEHEEGANKSIDC